LPWVQKGAQLEDLKQKRGSRRGKKRNIPAASEGLETTTKKKKKKTKKLQQQKTNSTDPVLYSGGSVSASGPLGRAFSQSEPGVSMDE
jgi:hypothetical protein